MKKSRLIDCKEGTVVRLGHKEYHWHEIVIKKEGQFVLCFDLQSYTYFQWSATKEVYIEKEP